jgi:hypothetical protein
LKYPEKRGDDMTLTDDEIAVFYAIFTCAERVDWACYDAFRLRILAEGAEQTRVSHNGHADLDAGRRIGPEHSQEPGGRQLDLLQPCDAVVAASADLQSPHGAAAM